MEDALSLIEAIIEDHKQIMKETEALQHDLDAAFQLDRAAGDFEPASLDPARRSLESLQGSLESVHRGLEGHFNREEKALLRAFEEHGSGTVASALRALLTEHRELRDRIAKSKQDAAALASATVPREVWEGKAHSIRAYLNHTRKLLERHARSEDDLLQTARKDIEGRVKGDQS